MSSGGEQIANPQNNPEADKFVDDISISSNENSANQNKGDNGRRKKKYRDSRSKSKDNASATNNWGNQSDDKNEENWGDDQNNAERQKNTTNNGWGDEPEENKIDGNETNWQNEQDDNSYDKRKENRRAGRDGARSARYQRSNERYNRSRERGDRYSRRNNRQQIYYPNFDKPLVTRREFEQDQDGRFDRNELNEAYKDYVNQYKKEQENSFYYDHKHEPWFIEKYDPCEIFFWRNKHDEYARFQADKFLNTVLNQLDQEDCPYKKINMEQQPNIEYTDLNGQDFDLQKAPHFAFDPDNKTLFLRYVPVQVKRADIISCFEQENIPGLVHLSMSRPIINHNFQRLAWASFNNDHECEQALQKIQNTTIEINDFRLQAIMCRERKNRQTKSETVIICPQLPESQIKYDYILCKKLITQVFDKEKKISSDVMTKIDQIEDIQVKLDLCLLYLRRVHAFCLYCTQDYEDERMLATPGQCGPQHLRNISKIPKEEFDELYNSVVVQDSKIEEPKGEGETPKEEIQPVVENAEEKEKDPDAEIFKEIKCLLNLDADSSSRWSGSLTFLKKYVSSAINRIEQGPRSPPDDPNQVINDFKAQDIEDFCTYKSKEIESGKKYQCEICTKQFKGMEFVLKHIKNKHQDVIDETYERESTKSWINKKIQQKFKKQMKITYFADQNKLFQQPGYVNAKKQAYGDRGQRGGDWGRNGQNQGNQRGRGGKYSSAYVDYDDPNINAKRVKEKNQERIVDYGDLFG